MKKLVLGLTLTAMAVSPTFANSYYNGKVADTTSGPHVANGITYEPTGHGNGYYASSMFGARWSAQPAFADRSYYGYRRAPTTSGPLVANGIAFNGYDAYAAAPQDLYGGTSVRGPAFGPGPVYAYGRYQGSDPDSFIRLQLRRDPPNLAH